MSSGSTTSAIKSEERLHLLVKGRKSISSEPFNPSRRTLPARKLRVGSTYANSRLTSKVEGFKMRLLDKLKVKPSNRHRSRQVTAVVYGTEKAKRTGKDLAANLPEEILEQIFIFLCPHSVDLSYESWDETAGFGKGCKLCQTRDLARCIRVCKSWQAVAQKLLYQSVRIDITHYCGLMDNPYSQSKSASYRKSNIEPEDPVQRRLVCFTRTARNNQVLGHLTKCLKVPWMIRETARPDLARAVSALPNLQHIDLPSGEYEKPAVDLVLNQELLRKCSDLRKMRYNKGADKTFHALALETTWPNLEILELNNISVDPEIFLTILASFSDLRELRLTNVVGLDDGIFSSVQGLPSFPALMKLTLEGPTQITIEGLCTYLSNPFQKVYLASLLLIDTSLMANQLHKLLSAAPGLKQLTYQGEVSSTINTISTPLLVSSTLETLHYEIHSTSPDRKVQLESHDNYLHKSIVSGSLPNLETLSIHNDRLQDSTPSQNPISPALSVIAFRGLEPANSANDSSNLPPSTPTSTLSSGENNLSPGFGGRGLLTVPLSPGHPLKTTEMQQQGKGLSWRKSLNFQPAKAGSEWMGA